MYLFIGQLRDYSKHGSQGQREGKVFKGFTPFTYRVLQCKAQEKYLKTPLHSHTEFS